MSPTFWYSKAKACCKKESVGVSFKKVCSLSILDLAITQFKQLKKENRKNQFYPAWLIFA
jgi:hypothetical protein